MVELHWKDENERVRTARMRCRHEIINIRLNRPPLTIPRNGIGAARCIATNITRLPELLSPEHIRSWNADYLADVLNRVDELHHLGSARPVTVALVERGRHC
jgi:hypothetical protein